jgi:general secretion pathway protein L
MQSIVIRLGTQFPEKVSWAKVSQEGGVVVNTGTLADVAKVCEGRRVAVLVPGMDVLLSSVAVPGSHRKQIEQAVGYAFEDYLAADVEMLHFALGKKNEDGRYNIAVVADEKMSSWVEPLREAGIEPHVMVPETLAVPYEHGAWSILLEGDSAFVRTGKQSGYGVDVDNLSAVLTVQGKEAGADGDNQVVFYNCTTKGMDFVLPVGVTVKNDDLRAKVAECDPLQLFVKGFDGNETINLLQGRFKRHAEWERAWGEWGLPAILLAVVLALYGTLLGSDYLSLRSESKRLSNAIEKVYKDTFPDSKKIVNPRAQMEQKLSELRGNGIQEKGGFLELLSKTGNEMVDTADYDIRNLKYKDGILIYDLQVKSLEDLDSLKTRLGKSGLDVDIKSATSKGGNVQARLQVS